MTTLELDPTNRCNHKCVFCSDWINRQDFKDLKYTLIKKIIKDARLAGFTSVVVKGGGEPTLHPNFENILKCIKRNELKCGLITNGSKLYKHRKVISDVCSWVRISLDSADKKRHKILHGSDDFDIILKGIKSISDKVKTGLNFVYFREEYDPDSYEAMRKNLGCKYYTTIEVRGIGKATDVGRDNGITYDICNAVKHVLVVCADGYLYPCCYTRGMKEHRIGHMSEIDFFHLQKEKIFNKYKDAPCRDICSGQTSPRRYDYCNLKNVKTNFDKGFA